MKTPKKRSASKQGSINKKKTRDWYREQGYASEYQEHLQSIFTPKGMLYKKNDVFASDGVSMNGKEIIFWNAKGETQKGKGTLGSSLKKFSQFPFPDFVIREIVVWEPRKKNPYRLRTHNGEIYSLDCDGNRKDYEYRNINLVEKK